MIQNTQLPLKNGHEISFRCAQLASSFKDRKGQNIRLVDNGCLCNACANKKAIKIFSPNRLIFSVHQEGFEPPTF